MYGKGLAAANTALGISLFPNIGHHRLLFVIGVALLTSGVVIFAVSLLQGRKRTAAN